MKNPNKASVREFDRPKIDHSRIPKPWRKEEEEEQQKQASKKAIVKAEGKAQTITNPNQNTQNLNAKLNPTRPIPVLL